MRAWLNCTLCRYKTIWPETVILALGFRSRFCSAFELGAEVKHLDEVNPREQTNVVVLACRYGLDAPSSTAHAGIGPQNRFTSSH